MNKGFFKYIFKLIILFCILWGIFIIITRNFGMYIYDEEYASYKQTIDYIKNSNEYNEVLIFGDSVAKAGVIPELLSDKTYNISMAGATTIEQYYMLQEYLENHEAPKAIIMMYFVGGKDSIDDFFWNRTLYFNCLSTKQFLEIAQNGAFDEDKIGAFSEFLQYKLCSPNKYYAAIKNAILENNRYEINRKEYETAVKTKGQHYFGTEEKYDSNNVTITGKKNFKILNIIDIYMKKSIELCEKNGIQVILEQHPINESTYANMSNDYKNEYIAYMKSLQEKYPNAKICTEFNICKGEWLGDFSHLNENGATQFTKKLKEKYSEYFN